MTYTRSILLVAALLSFVACKKKVEVADLPGSFAPEAGAVAAVVPPAVVDRMISNFQRVHFEFDSADLDTDSKGALQSNVKIMMEHPDLSLLVQGHCDERGTTDYNLALGDRRAQAVFAYMKTAGVASSRLRTVSMGEEVPLSAESGERAWSQNRRAEFIIVSGSGELVRGTVSGG